MNNEKDDTERTEIFELMNGAVRVWKEQGAVHIKAVDNPFNDPVELTASMARQLGQRLLLMAEEVEDQ
jgi:hypothetical protein